MEREVWRREGCLECSNCRIEGYVQSCLIDGFVV